MGGKESKQKKSKKQQSNVPQWKKQQQANQLSQLSQQQQQMPHSQMNAMPQYNVQPMMNTMPHSNAMPQKNLSARTKFTPLQQMKQMPYQQNLQQVHHSYANRALPVVDGTFNDDEPINEKKVQQMSQMKKPEKINLKESIQLSLVPKQKIFKLDKDNTQKFPFMCKLLCKDAKEEGGNRTPVDIVCVIDRSGSMNWDDKWKNVVQTMKDLCELLMPEDRLAIVSFQDDAQRDSKLIRMNKNGVANVNNTMQDLSPGGSTNIGAGMFVACKILSERKYKNPVSSILLLTDGQDDYGKEYIVKCINHWKHVGAYTINTFGFGNDHDSTLMTYISDQKDGNFYFIEDVKKVGICFIDCLGQLFSVFAENVVITIKASPPKQISDVMISKAFGGECMWHINENNEYSTKILQVYQGMKKNYMIELEIPPASRQLQDHEKSVSLCQARCVIETVDCLQKVELRAQLQVVVLNPGEQVQEQEENEEVIENYYRVKSAEVMTEARKIADKGNFKKAQQIVTQIMQFIQSSKAFQKSECLKNIVKDLQNARHQLKPQIYQASGKHYMMSQARNQLQQRSNPLYSNANQNLRRKGMVKQYKMKKGFM